MAKVRLNPLLEQLLGSVGDLVVKSRHGKPYVASRPAPGTYKLTPAREAQQKRLRMANMYASAAMADPAAVAHYTPIAARQPSPLPVFTTIVGDYLSKPEITDLDVSAYTGAAGGIVRVQARDRYGVVRVEVALSTTDGSLIESGEATFQGAHWVYHAQQNAQTGEQVRITARAMDWPNNVAEASKTRDG